MGGPFLDGDDTDRIPDGRRCHRRNELPGVALALDRTG
jgi:hypothetical protein